MKNRLSHTLLVATHKKIAWLAGLTLATCYITGCATMNGIGGMSASECQQSNWQTIGYQDGLMGRTSDYIERHIRQCAKSSQSTVSNAVPNRNLWEQGRQEGIKRYCTPLRAYQLGREGYQYHDVCPTEITLELLKAHDEGYINYQREQMLNQLWYDNDPFFGGWGTPFYGGFGSWGSRMRVPMPRPVPAYPNNNHLKYIQQQYATPANLVPNTSGKTPQMSSDTAITPTTDANTTEKN